MSQSEKTVVNEAKQRRSPISPIIPIDEAIQKARQIYAKDRRAFTDFKTLSEHIGYKVKNKGGTAGRALSALKQYGLLDERNGQYRISETAWKILEMEEDSEERARLIKEAALRPPVIRRILSFYDGELPSDATLRNHLLFTEGFNTDTAANFIKVLRRTIELVNPSPEDYNAGEESEGAEPPPSGATPMRMPPPSIPTTRSTGMTPPADQGLAASTVEPPPGMHFPLYLSKDKQAALYVPWVMTKDEWDLLKEQVEFSLKIARATTLIVDDPPRQPPGAETESETTE